MSTTRERSPLDDALLADKANADRKGGRVVRVHAAPLPHPSPRNIGWFMANPWLRRGVAPAPRERVRETFA